jgi:UDP-3-O-[3-hydroxymyristoyl] glucosamine N-acyltransferase
MNTKTIKNTIKNLKSLLVSKKKKHFELTEETIEFMGSILHRIKATKNLPHIKVKKGDLGGFIEEESNLKDKAWVFNEAKVFGGAEISQKATIRGEAIIYGKSKIFGKIEIDDNTKVSGKLEISEKGIFGNNIHIFNL